MPIGASEGEVASHVAIGISLSSQTVHAFPISANKAVQDNGEDWVFSTDILQGLTS